MSEGINLVTSTDKRLEKKLFQLKVFRMIAIASLVIVSGVSIVVFIINVTLPIDSVKKEEASTQANISYLHGKFVRYYLMSDRIKNIQQVMSERKDFSKPMSAVLSKVSPDLAVDSIDVETGIIGITVSGVSLEPIDSFINQIIKMGDEEKMIKNVSVEGLVLSARTGRYSLTMKAEML